MEYKIISKNIARKKFKEINLKDEFFNSLRNDYPNFEKWFEKKSDEYAYIHCNDDERLDGFLYLKLEEGYIENTDIQQKFNKILKLGTFKIDAHGTRLGERFIKLSLDFAIRHNVSICYLTIFSKYENLIKLIEEYGFIKSGKVLNKDNEFVYIKYLNKVTGNIYKDYPLLNIKNKNIYLLSIYPKYHSIMFPDSLLKTESTDILKDLSYTNSIKKIYVCNLREVEKLKYGDILLIYRTREDNKPAKYSSVLSSICVVDEVKYKDEFNSFEEFYNYSVKYSVFDKKELIEFYKKEGTKIIKLTYNFSLNKKIIRKDLTEEVGIEKDYWGFFDLNKKEFTKIIEMSQTSENLIVDL